MVESVVILLFPAALVYAAVSDLATYQIPNWLSLAVVVDFVAAAVVGSLDIAAFGWHLGAGVAVLVAGILMFARGIVGGGDAKLMAACAFWVGWAGLAIGIAGVVMFKDLPLVASTASHEFEPWRTALAAAV